MSKIQTFPLFLAPDRRSEAGTDPLPYTERSKVSNKTRFVIVGAGWAGETIAEAILRHGKAEIVGFLDDKCGELTDPTILGEPIKILRDTRSIGEVLQEEGVTDLVVAVTHDKKDHLLKGVMEAFESNIRVHQMPDLYGQLTGKVPLKHIDEHWIAPHLQSPENGLGSMVVLVLDYCLTLLLFLFLFIPVFPFVAILIKLSSQGPVFFLQKRVGYRGKRFTIFKLRTMAHLARRHGASWTTVDDARITKLGAFLRKYRIDELPQLWNVLKGDMALIGPRPEAVDLVSKYRKEIPFYEFRYLVKPGITGWAQVKYKNTCSVDGALEKLQYDLYWIKKLSPLLHLKVAIKTVRVTLTGFGSV